MGRGAGGARGGGVAGRGDGALPTAPEYGPPKQLETFEASTGTIRKDQEDIFRITDYGGLTVVQTRLRGRQWAKVYESTSGLLVFPRSFYITGKVTDFRAAVQRLNGRTNWGLAARGGLNEAQQRTLYEAGRELTEGFSYQ